MARASRYSPAIGMALLVLGAAVGGGLAWLVVPALVGAPKPAASTSPAVRRAPGDPARTQQVVDQAVQARTAKTLVPSEAPKPDASPAARPDVVEPAAQADASADAASADATPVPPEQQVDLPEYKRLERPFALRCPSVLNRYDRAASRFEPVAVDVFCNELRGRFQAILFWRGEGEATNPALALFQANADALAKGTPPTGVVYVSSERFPSDLKAFFEAEGASWTFSTFQGPVDGWLTNYGSTNPDRSFPWLVVTDPERMVLFEGPAMQTADQMKGFQKFLAAMAAARTTAKADDGKRPDATNQAADTNDDAKKNDATARKDKLADAGARKGATGGGAVGGRREIDYVTLGLQVMRLFPDLAGTPDLRQVVKLSEQSLNAKLKKMGPGEANRLAANLPDALVREAVKAALKSLGK